MGELLSAPQVLGRLCEVQNHAVVRYRGGGISELLFPKWNTRTPEIQRAEMDFPWKSWWVWVAATQNMPTTHLPAMTHPAWLFLPME